MKKRILLVLVVLSSAVVLPAAFAQTPAAPAVGVHTVKNTGDVKLTYGFMERIRHEFWKNTADYNNGAKDNRNLFRFKTSLWGQADLNEDLGVYLRLTNEFKSYTYWYQSSNRKKGIRGDIHEVVMDNFYADFKNLLDGPLNLRVGRQDFLNMYGEGFLIQDGTPLDGSRTYYFNAIKGSWKADDKNNIDFIYLNNPKEEKFFPLINGASPAQALNTSDETGYIVYWKNKAIDKLALEPFYIYKTEDQGGTRLQAQKGRLNTPGVYAKYDLDPFTLRGQVAYQSGNYGTNDREAFGGYAFVDRVFKDTKWSPKLTAGYLYLSGDDPSTATNEGYDSLWGRWPMWSELYLLSFGGESGTGYWTNLQMPRVMLEISPTKEIKVQTAYNFLMANENPTGTGFSVGDGKNRGHLPQCKVSYALNKNISTYFLAEYLIPGNFYANTADPALFLRTEMMIKF